MECRRNNDIVLMLSARLSGELRNTIDLVMPIINFIKSTSILQRRLLHDLLAHTSAKHCGLLLHNDL